MARRRHTNTGTKASALELLRRRYPAPAYVFLAEVSNATGFNAIRHADGLAVSIWPSRGLHFIGFEIKSARGDWIKELNSPEKAEIIAKYCHYWWLVCESDAVAAADEIPATWGHMVVKDGKLVTLKEPALMTPAPPTVSFIAAVIRRWAEHMVPKALLEAEINRGRVAIQEQAQETRSHELTKALEEKTRLRKVIADFEANSGIRLDAGEFMNYQLPAIGQAVKAIMNRASCGVELNTLTRAATELRRQLEAITGAIEQLRTFRAAQDAATDVLDARDGRGPLMATLQKEAGRETT